MESAENFVSLKVLELGVIALVGHLELDNLKDNLFELALVESAFTNPYDVVKVEGVVLLNVRLVIREQIVVDLQVPEGSPPFVGDPLLVGFPHLLDFLVILVGLLLLFLEVLDVLNSTHWFLLAVLRDNARVLGLLLLVLKRGREM